MYPGFPVPNVEWGAIWDTSEPVDDDLTDYEDDQNNDLNEFGDEVAEDRENVDFNNLDVEGKNEDSDIEEEFDDWGNEDENEQEDNH